MPRKTRTAGVMRSGVTQCRSLIQKTASARFPGMLGRFSEKRVNPRLTHGVPSCSRTSRCSRRMSGCSSLPSSVRVPRRSRCVSRSTGRPGRPCSSFARSRSARVRCPLESFRALSPGSPARLRTRSTPWPMTSRGRSRPHCSPRRCPGRSSLTPQETEFSTLTQRSLHRCSEQTARL